MPTGQRPRINVKPTGEGMQSIVKMRHMSEPFSGGIRRFALLSLNRNHILSSTPSTATGE